MHIEYKDNNSLKIYIFDKKKIKDIGINKDNEGYFKNLFLILKNKYHILLNGLYKIDVYYLNYYGLVLEISKEEDEIYDFINGINIKVKVNDNYKTLFKIEDVFHIRNKRNIKIYKNQNNYYILFKGNPSKKELFSIIEHSKVIYGPITKKIIKPYNQIKI